MPSPQPHHKIDVLFLQSIEGEIESGNKKESKKERKIPGGGGWENSFREPRVVVKQEQGKGSEVCPPRTSESEGLNQKEIET